MGSRLLTESLRTRLASAAPDDFVEVIVELEPSASDGDLSALGRQAKIDALKTSFFAAAAPIEEAIAGFGGQVVDKAWINNTLRVRMPVARLEQLTRLRPVALVDLPRQLEPDLA